MTPLLTQAQSFGIGAERTAKLSVALDVPLATHRGVTGLAAFAIKQNPFSALGRLGALARIVLRKPALHIGRPADIGSAIVPAAASQNIDEKSHLEFARWPVSGCHPESKRSVGGAEKTRTSDRRGSVLTPFSSVATHS